MIQIRGKGISSGVVSGPLAFYRRTESQLPVYEVEDAEAEWQRFLDAQSQAIDELGALADRARVKAGEDVALLFESHQVMADDLDYVEAVKKKIVDERCNAEAATAAAGERFTKAFEVIDDAYIRARGADIRDISQRITRILSGMAQRDLVQRDLTPDTPVILVADDLAPSETIQLDKSKVLGFVTAGGSSTSHTAILARTMGIPAVIGVGEQLRAIHSGLEAIVDGDTGHVVLDPDEQTRSALMQKRAEQLRRQEMLTRLKGLENMTKDGQPIRIHCNISSTEDVQAVLDNDSDGIGLFRCEFLYPSWDSNPSEDRQFEAYKKVLSAMGDREVIIRTLDLGADALPDQKNPALGCRGVRICFQRPEIFHTQLRALYRASAFGKLGILFPMITSLWEVREIKARCAQVQQELREEGIPFRDDVDLGLMIETPAAAVISDCLAREVDFFSFGTNDLTQYTLACDRQNDDLDRFYDPHHPALLRLLQMVTDNAHKNGIWVGISGELGADQALTETFLAMGIDELSVSPHDVLPLREKVRSIDVSACRRACLEKFK